MNARSQIFELTVEGRQIDEVVASLFHTLLLHRTVGKISYNSGSYSIGTIGVTDVDCDFVDFTYVRVSSDELNDSLMREISAFRNHLRESETGISGQISLEFYQKKKSHWPFATECIPWEVWTIKLNIKTLNTELEHQLCRESTSESLTEKVLYIAKALNSGQYIPKIPTQSELEFIFDTSYTDIQPYLYKICHQTVKNNSTVSSTMKKLFKDSLSF